MNSSKKKKKKQIKVSLVGYILEFCDNLVKSA